MTLKDDLDNFFVNINIPIAITVAILVVVLIIAIAVLADRCCPAKERAVLSVPSYRRNRKLAPTDDISSERVVKPIQVKNQFSAATGVTQPSSAPPIKDERFSTPAVTTVPGIFDGSCYPNYPNVIFQQPVFGGMNYMPASFHSNALFDYPTNISYGENYGYQPGYYPSTNLRYNSITYLGSASNAFNFPLAPQSQMLPAVMAFNPEGGNKGIILAVDGNEGIITAADGNIVNEYVAEYPASQINSHEKASVLDVAGASCGDNASVPDVAVASHHGDDASGGLVKEENLENQISQTLTGDAIYPSKEEATDGDRTHVPPKTMKKVYKVQNRGLE